MNSTSSPCRKTLLFASSEHKFFSGLGWHGAKHVKVEGSKLPGE